MSAGMGLGLAIGAAAYSARRALLSPACSPPRAKGPSREAREHGSFRVEIHARTTGGERPPA